ncbi:MULTISPECIES: rhamnogalacturonan lyase B N-terminal domain-containing protein [Streptomyces]|uniref:rhamnogalacturonan lyase B N-terminal domain-containing protein n=1 Tax=Streptomyces TaxID=1883 RepID=UPI000A3BF8A6|nr:MULTISPECIES: rhamnogalacturonan lyase B N-terminal domain-containing protein [Streptomyces]MDX3585364.1 rhamnogalacturonan lyase B N-terminal domain-containing protein [Streptomyces europaeiscabiei]MDX3616974.1 rhamnogalacturonan lyase B N-terminal domain-containing protein [Streptomyces europaeiscabiei]MDX3635308.1 rhamnogalacturonan lyase B N-terminal domain-containing protein [Streptomyces europaeiscabiei]MDX3653580.1 rhamnogalacturonan lyase B N-terminal domain-containing protein [Strep
MSTHKRRLTRRRVLGAGALGVAATGAAVAGGTGLLSTASAAGFGHSDDGKNVVVDTGANLVFKVSRTTGDLTSLRYRGKEYEGYGGRHSHVESGLGASTVTVKQSGSTILIKAVHGAITQWYAARSGQNNVYLWTNKADASFTATRFLVRLKPGMFPNEGPDSWIEASDKVIEAGDVWRRADGTTHSKHYSGKRVVDYDHIGFTTGSVGLWIVRSNHEKASGGPFYRSLLRHSNDLGAGLYEILHYNQAQTEAERFGLQGPYVLAFTDGGAPSASLAHDKLDTSWVDGLGITGWVGRAGRGKVAGVGLKGMDARYAYTVGFANKDAQYWAKAAAGTGAFSCRGMLPGTYTLTVHKGELAVHTREVKVTAGGSTALNSITITGDPSTAKTLWRLGDWDGTPGGFKNADLMTHAHPSDGRAAKWTGNVTLGAGDPAASFPAYIWQDVNDGIRVFFKLTAAQAAAAHTLRIGVTDAFAGGRPRVSINDWVSPIPAAPKQPSTRSLTTGSYRGNNHTFTYSVPASAWKSNTSQYNVLKLNIVSGSSGTAFLSPGTSFDCVDLLA